MRDTDCLHSSTRSRSSSKGTQEGQEIISEKIDKERPHVGLRQDQRRFQSQEIIREMRSVGSLRCHTAEGCSRNDRGPRCVGELHQELHSRCFPDTPNGIRRRSVTVESHTSCEMVLSGTQAHESSNGEKGKLWNTLSGEGQSCLDVRGRSAVGRRIEGVL